MCLLVNFLIRRENYIFLTRRRKPFKNFTEYLSCYLFNILTTLKIDATFVVCVCTTLFCTLLEAYHTV